MGQASKIQRCIEAGVFIPLTETAAFVDSSKVGISNTFNRAELAHLLHLHHVSMIARDCLFLILNQETALIF